MVIRRPERMQIKQGYTTIDQIHGRSGLNPNTEKKKSELLVALGLLLISLTYGFQHFMVSFMNPAQPF